MYSVTITVPSLDILARIADAVKQEGVAPTEVLDPKPARTLRDKFAGKSDTKAEAKQESKAEPKATETKVSNEDLFNKVKDVTALLIMKDHNVAVATLKQFSAVKVSDLKPEQHMEYIKSVEKILENYKTDLIS